MPHIQAIFFDLYETLVTEFDPDWVPRNSVPARLGIPDSAFRKEWDAIRELRFAGTFADYASCLVWIGRTLGHSIDDETLEQLQQERLSEKTKPFTRIEPTIIRMLQSLRELPMRIGLISNCDAEEVAAWWDCSLASYFDDVVFSYQVGRVKPQPSIYRLACERLSVQPEHAMFVGDGGSDELRGASQLGMFACQATWFLDRWHATTRTHPKVACPTARTPHDLLSLVALASGDISTDLVESPLSGLP